MGHKKFSWGCKKMWRLMLLQFIFGEEIMIFFLVMVMLALKSRLLIINLGSNHQHPSLCVCWHLDGCFFLLLPALVYSLWWPEWSSYTVSPDHLLKSVGTSHLCKNESGVTTIASKGPQDLPSSLLVWLSLNRSHSALLWILCVYSCPLASVFADLLASSPK